MTYTVEQRHEQARLTALADELENCRVLAAWRETQDAERQRRAELMACWLGDVWTREEEDDGQS